MALTNPYCQVAQLRAHLGDTNEQLDIDLLERAINATSRAIDKWCGRRFWIDTEVKTRTYHPTNPYEVWVDDIATTDGLIVKTGTGGTFGTTWSSTTYELHPRDIELDFPDAYAWWRIRALEGTFPVGQRYPTVQIIGKGGWSAIAADVEQAGILRSAAIFKRNEAVFGVAGFGEFGAVRISRRGDPDVVDLLEPFVKRGFG